MKITNIAFSKNTLFINNASYAEAYNRVSALNDLELNALFNDLFKSADSYKPVIYKVMSLHTECMRNGFMFDTASMCVLCLLDEPTLDMYISDIMEYLEERFSNSTAYHTLFGDFPNTVLSLSDMEYYFYQIIHYMSFGEFVPNDNFPETADALLFKNHLFVNKDKSSYRTVTIGSQDTVKNIFRTLASSKQSLTAYDTDILKFICSSLNEPIYAYKRKEYLDDLEIPFKETLCMLANEWEEVTLSTMTDVLRFARYMSLGITTLDTKDTLYFSKKMPRAVRRRIMQLLNDVCKSKCKKVEGTHKSFLTYNEIVSGLADWITDEEHKYHSVWVRLGELVHPGEFKTKYVYARAAFDIIRDDNKKTMTFNGKVENAMARNDFNAVMKLLSNRPGEFIRRFAHIMRVFGTVGITTDCKNAVLSMDPDKFGTLAYTMKSQVLPEVSTKVLYDFIEYLCAMTIDGYSANRIVSYYAGSSIPKMYKLPESTAIDIDIIENVISWIKDELRTRYALKNSAADEIYMIDESLSKIALPKDMRSMSAGMNQLTRGSKIKMDNYDNVKKIRLYCRWYDAHGNMDFDLYSGLLDENGNTKDIIAWNRSRIANNYAVFSGDVRMRKGYCAEYIDVDKKLALENGVRYIIMNIYDFNHGAVSFTDSDVYAGILDVTDSNIYKSENSKWYPKDIVYGSRIITTAANVIAGVFDILTGEYLLIDMPSNGICDYGNQQAIAYAFEKYVKYSTVDKFNILDVIRMNIESWGACPYVFAASEIDIFKKFKKEFFELYEDDTKREALDEYIKTAFADNSNLLSVGNTIEDLANSLKRVHFVEYTDVAGDYTQMLEWL